MKSSSPTEAELKTRIQQQEVVADLGQQALETDDLDQLMEDAAVAVAETLNTEYARVLELLPGGDGVLLRQGVGWRDGLVGEVILSIDRDTQAGCTLLSEEPVIVDDLETEERFSGSELLTSHNVVSGVSAIIGSVDEPWGILGAHTTERQEVTEHDVTFLQTVTNILASAVENERARSELEEIFGRISDAFFALNENWEFTYLNERAHELINPEGRELIGNNFWDEFPDATSRKFKSKYERAMHDQETVSFEEYYPEPLDRWFEVRAYPSETGLSVYFQDATERKERLRQLTASERRFRALTDDVLDTSDVGTFILDSNFEVVWINQAAEQYFGLDREAVVGRDKRRLIEEEIAPIFEAPDRFTERVTATYDDNTYTEEFECHVLEDDDREERWLNHWSQPIESGLYAGGRIEHYTDITEQIRRKRELERALDLLNKTERIADVASWEGDPDTQEPYWSDHLFNLVDVSSDEQPSLDEALDVYHTEDDRRIVENAIEEALDSGEPFDVEARFPRPSGDVGWLHVQGDPVVEDDEVVTLRGAVQDVTERKRREQRLEELVERLEESNERLEKFAYAASHDLQEPLRMVTSYLELIEDRYADALDEDGEEFIGFAVDGAERMREMINGLLEYSRVETRGGPFESVDLDDVLSDVCNDLQVKIDENDTEITARDLPCVEGDVGQLRQVFQNLLDNAIEYSGDEPAQIHVSAERDGEEWVVSISDEGIGIDRDHTDDIFEVFQRLHTQDEHAGTGIGLALCERIVERHGGEIRVDSEPGEGSTFSFTLPATDS